MTKFKTPALKKLQAWSETNKVSTSTMATRLSCHTSQVWRWLHGDAQPSVVKRVLISELTNGEVSEADWLTKDELEEIEAGRAKLGAA